MKSWKKKAISRKPNVRSILQQILNSALRTRRNFEASFWKEAVLQVDKELQKDYVVDLIDKPRLIPVDRLHLIANIHIELFREFAIDTEEDSVLIES